MTSAHIEKHFQGPGPQGVQAALLKEAQNLIHKDQLDLLTLSDLEMLKITDEQNLDKPIMHISLPMLGQSLKKITPELAEALGARNQTIIHLFINHPSELTLEFFKACSLLADAGIILNNHTTLLKGINDNSEDIKSLNLKLIMMRVRPYSIYLNDFKLTGHEMFNVSEEQGITILESLRGWTSGLAVPHLLVQNEEGIYQAKLPNYIKENEGEHFVFRNYKNMNFDYINK